MIKHKDHFHGSDLEKIEAVYGIQKENIINFAANVNPLGISPNLKAALCEHIDAITAYPDREYTSLRTCIGNYCHIDASHILVGNGSTELISLFIQITHPKHALLLGPTYSEYEREINLGGGTTACYLLDEKENFKLNVSEFISNLNSDIDLLVICNPNNPTSSAITQNDLGLILDACQKLHIYVMVDETYVEFADNIKAIDAVPLTLLYDNLIILRGTSKFFAAPGLRLGYAITGNHSLISKVNARKNPWTINSLAVVAGETMFMDQNYIQQTRALILSERTKMYQALDTSSVYKVYPAYGNFILAKILSDSVTSQEVFDRAIRQNMMIRDCFSFPSLGEKYIRFCIMKPEDNKKLLECLLL